MQSEDLIPPRARELIGIVGPDAAQLLCDSFNHLTGFYVPIRVREGSALALLIGLEASQALCSAWGGRVVQFPKMARLKAAERDEAIRELRFTKHARIATICQIHDVTVSTVYRALNGGGK